MVHQATEVVTARPYALIIRATERCEVGCEHCCISATGKGSDMEMLLAKQVFSEAKKSGIGLIHFSGGEPLLHDRLEELVRIAAAAGFYVEVTTSTFSTRGERPSSRVAALKAAGLRRVMLSYDASHARRVSIEQFAEFLCEAQSQDLEVCVMVVEWANSTWPLGRVKEECEARGVDGRLVDWCRSDLSLVGRAEGAFADISPPSGEDARCQYVLTAPTVAPDGRVFLCPNLQSRSKLFQIGNVKDAPLSEILEDLQASRFYQVLSVMGPHRIAKALGLPADETPKDMCRCCQLILQKAEAPEFRARIEELLPENSPPATLELDALLPGHKRFVLGEERPAEGCLCG